MLTGCQNVGKKGMSAIGISLLAIGMMIKYPLQKLLNRMNQL